MSDHIAELLQTYRQKGILVDTNILLLFLVGATNRNRISRFKRTVQFTPQDYDLLVKLLAFFSQVITTPYILTEVNSLLNQLEEPDRGLCLKTLGVYVNQVEEDYVHSKQIVQQEKFTTFGLTDCGMLEIAKGKYLILTDDLRLADYLGRSGVDTVNFNHLRVYGW